MIDKELNGAYGGIELGHVPVFNEGLVLRQTVVVPHDHELDAHSFMRQVLESQNIVCPYCKEPRAIGRTVSGIISEEHPKRIHWAVLLRCSVCIRSFHASCSVQCGFTIDAGGNIRNLENLPESIDLSIYPPITNYGGGKAETWRRIGIDEGVVFLYEQACAALDGGSFIFGGAGMRSVLERMLIVYTERENSKNINLEDLIKESGLKDFSLDLLRLFGNDLLHYNEIAQDFSLELAQKMRALTEGLIDKYLVASQNQKNSEKEMKRILEETKK